MFAVFARAASRRVSAGVATAAAFGLPLCTVKAQEGPVQSRPFSLTEPKYDQSNYWGRLYSIFDKIDPRTLLVDDQEVKRCQALLAEFSKSRQLPPRTTNDDMWAARKTVEAVIHPVTGEVMFAPCRMSAFGPMNVPISVLLLQLRSPAGMIFSQWLNQSYNTCCNYVNRSSREMEFSELVAPYALAVGVSVGIALGARRMVQAIPSLTRWGATIPYLAVAAAGSANVAFTRMDEWRGRGIVVCGADGKELGMSQNAGQQAVLNTILTRSICLPVPVLLVPPIVMGMVPVTGLAATVTEVFVVVGCLAFALPAALAILPQQMTIAVGSLEPKFQMLTDGNGKPLTEVFANKGL